MEGSLSVLDILNKNKEDLVHVIGKRVGLKKIPRIREKKLRIK